MFTDLEVFDEDGVTVMSNHVGHNQLLVERSILCSIIYLGFKISL